jgi:hypothetical protein
MTQAGLTFRRMRHDPARYLVLLLAIVGMGSAVSVSAAIKRMPGFLRVRPVFDDWHAVFEGTPDKVRRQLQQELALDGIRCVSVPLEE